MARLLDPKRNGKYPFDYTPSAQTDVAKTWAKARKAQESVERERKEKVRPMTNARAGRAG